jgi:uncharacterized RDD family membrane protein YckC
MRAVEHMYRLDEPGAMQADLLGSSMTLMDYYLVLGVDEQSGAAEIREAYRRLARKYHPDINPQDARAAMRFKLVSDAYKVLSDPVQRSAYQAPLPFGKPARHDTEVQVPSPIGSASSVLLPSRPQMSGKPPHARWSAPRWYHRLAGWSDVRGRTAAAWWHSLAAIAASYRDVPEPRTGGGGTLASFGQRLTAFLIDIAVLAISMLLFMLAIGAIGAIFDLGIDGSSYSETNDILVLVLFFSPAYFITLWTLYGRTLGCAVTDLKVRQMSGAPLTVRVAALRWLCGLVSSIPFFLGFLWLLRDTDGLAWNDRLSGSIILQEQLEHTDLWTS